MVGAVVLAGALGAVCRVLVGSVAPSTRMGTLAVNIGGSFAAGLLAAWFVRGLVPADIRVGAGAGFLGAFTTWSTFAVDTVEVGRDRGSVVAATHVVLGVGGSIVAAALGWLLGN